VELTWSVAESAALTDFQRALIRDRLARRIDAAGVLRVVSSATRSQLRNREAAEERLADLVRGALATRAKRKITRVPRGAVEARLQAKKRASDKKRNRRGAPGLDDE
jgi:ribosome-associated protein